MNYKFVLIHGWGGSRESLTPLARELESMLEKDGSGASAETKILELPGFGQTELKDVYTLADYENYLAGQIADFVSAEELDSHIVMVGHSFGGKLLLSLASQERLGKARLVLISASGIKPKNSLKKLIFKTITWPYKPVRFALQSLGLRALEKLMQKAFYKFVVRTRDYQKIENPIVKETFKNVIASHIELGALKNITNPTLLLWGREDRDTPLWMAEVIQARVENSQLVVIDEATHGLPLRLPHECAQVIIKFIKSGDLA